MQARRMALAVGTGAGMGRFGGVGQSRAGALAPLGSQGAAAAGRARNSWGKASISAAVTV